ncbi:unnamed protein product [Rotaria socialis]|uniref:Uncharacterized protein n=1 Tax=Rotaria socialis TaxID=392032 RepID=A0A818ST08_9BILA|nr:unnamed protein product [Rotaria socialis]CAF3670273.1 unnamed protein product [Rotaria socialis]CAF4184526.1 unnamed protein product [Rotaria socialis]CAF4572322.1 unnamed protein product [Rotaria socialis]
MVMIESIRCGYDCPFVFLTFNLTISEHMCKNIEKDYAQCLLILQLDFDNHGGGGVLAITDIKEPDSLEITTEFGFNSTNTTIIYRCSISDNCAWEFLYELFSPALVEFNALAVQAQLRELLYNNKSDSSVITCTNHQCPSDSYCQAHLYQSSSFENSSLIINNHLPCVNAAMKPDMIKIEQRFSSFERKTTNMTLLCNRAECDKNETVLQAYNLMMNEFILPVNYSIFNSNTTITTTTQQTNTSPSSSVLSYARILLISTFLCFLLNEF